MHGGDKVRIQNLLMEGEVKRLRWIRDAEVMDRIRIPRWAVVLIFKGKKSIR
jgi:hypothetical protein